jgi:hypothetical protein
MYKMVNGCVLLQKDEAHSLSQLPGSCAEGATLLLDVEDEMGLRTRFPSSHIAVATDWKVGWQVSVASVVPLLGMQSRSGATHVATAAPPAPSRESPKVVYSLAGNIPELRKFMTVDHIRPRLCGYNDVLADTGFSVDHWTNLTAACYDCNQTRGTLPLLQFLVETRSNTGDQTLLRPL